MRAKYRNPFDKETELAAHFIEEAKSYGWIAYPETDGFDVLLVATAGVVGHFEAGDQIGVQAKLTPNLEVLYQSLPRKASWPGPTYYAALVPRATPEFLELASQLKIKVFEATAKFWPNGRYGRSSQVEWRIGPVKAFMDPPKLWHRHQHAKPCWFPEVQVEGLAVAGAAGPKQLTPWKFKAVKLALHGLQKGYLTSRDFADFDVSMSRWVQKGWIVPGAYVVENGKRLRSHKLIEHMNPPHLMYPEIVEALKVINETPPPGAG